MATTNTSGNPHAPLCAYNRLHAAAHPHQQPTSEYEFVLATRTPETSSSTLSVFQIPPTYTQTRLPASESLRPCTCTGYPSPRNGPLLHAMHIIPTEYLECLTVGQLYALGRDLEARVEHEEDEGDQQPER